MKTKDTMDNWSEELLADPVKLRFALAQDHSLFFHTVFAGYITYKTAPFQHEMLKITTGLKDHCSIFVAFRGSGKSTIVSLSLPLWAIFGKHQCKYIFIASQTQNQCQQILYNIKFELLSNPILRKIFGNFTEGEDEWKNNTIVLPKYGARISVISTGESMRGLRHQAQRPDLIILDDVENLESTRFKDQREKTYAWFNGEISPAGDIKTKIVIIGNLLHDDSLIMRLKKAILIGRFDGSIREYPLLGSNGEIIWQGKYPNIQAIEEQKRKIPSEIDFQREYLLRIISDENQPIKREWIRYYEDLPSGNNLIERVCGLDLAISKEETADYTAMIGVSVYEIDDQVYFYVQPTFIHKRIDFPTTINLVEQKILQLNDENSLFPVSLLVETVAYQAAAAQMLRDKDIYVREYQPGRRDKTTRLNFMADLFRNGRVFFPKEGCGELINELIYFGLERHDDLVDALIMALSVVRDLRPKSEYVDDLELNSMSFPIKL